MATIFGQGSSRRPVDDNPLLGTPEDDQIYGRGGNDVVDATQGGTDVIVTEDGNDTITAGTGDDQVFAGGGNNTIDALGGNNFVKTGKLGQDAGTTDDIDTADGDDVIAAGDGTNLVNAGNGNNQVTGGSGYDEFQVGTGADFVDLGAHGAADLGPRATPFGTFNAGNFLLDLGGADQINAGSPDPSDGGDDLIIDDWGYFAGLGTAAFGDDLINTGDGNDVIWTMGGNDTVQSGAGDDRIETSRGNVSGDDNIIAGAGEDFIRTRAGNDTIDGGDDEDTIIAGVGADRIVGGGDDDIIYLTNGDGARDADEDIVDYNAVTDVLGTDANGNTVNQADFVLEFGAQDKFDVSDLLPAFAGGVGEAVSGGYLNVFGATVGGQASSLVAVDQDGGGDNWLFLAFAVGNSSSLGTGLGLGNFIVDGAVA